MQRYISFTSMVSKFATNLRATERAFSSNVSESKNKIVKESLRKLKPEEYGNGAIRTNAVARGLYYSSYNKEKNRELIEQGKPIFLCYSDYYFESEDYKSLLGIDAKYQDSLDYLTAITRGEGLGVIKKTGSNEDDVSMFQELFHQEHPKESEVDIKVRQLIFMGKTEFAEKNAVRYALGVEFDTRKTSEVLLSKEVLHKFVSSMDDGELNQRSKERVRRKIDVESADSEDRLNFFLQERSNNSPIMNALLDTMESIRPVVNADSGLIDSRLKICTKQGHSCGVNYTIDTMPLKKQVEWRYMVSQQNQNEKAAKTL